MAAGRRFHAVAARSLPVPRQSVEFFAAFRDRFREKRKRDSSRYAVHILEAI